jgi:hypothetical protein
MGSVKNDGGVWVCATTAPSCTLKHRRYSAGVPKQHSLRLFTLTEGPQRSQGDPGKHGAAFWEGWKPSESARAHEMRVDYRKPCIH